MFVFVRTHTHACAYACAFAHVQLRARGAAQALNRDALLARFATPDLVGIDVQPAAPPSDASLRARDLPLFLNVCLFLQNKPQNPDFIIFIFYFLSSNFELL